MLYICTRFTLLQNVFVSDVNMSLFIFGVNRVEINAILKFIFHTNNKHISITILFNDMKV